MSEGGEAREEVCIRRERVEDHAGVYALVREAFAGAEHRDGTEQDLVEALRRGPAFVPELSLVATVRGEPVGHILFSRALVGSTEVLVLAPLAVLPRFQRQGVGSALVQEGLACARRLGFRGVLVLGSAQYYSRFGFRPAAGFGVEVPAGMLESCFLALPLGDVFPAGRVFFAEEFGL